MDVIRQLINSVENMGFEPALVGIDKNDFEENYDDETVYGFKKKGGKLVFFPRTEYIYRSNNNTLNINTETSFGNKFIPINGVLIKNDLTDYTRLNEEQIRINFTGRIKIRTHINYVSSNRISLNIMYYINGSQTGPVGDGYLRGASSDSNAAIILLYTMDVTNTDVLSISVKKDTSNSDVTTLDPNSVSFIRLERIA